MKAGTISQTSEWARLFDRPTFKEGVPVFCVHRFSREELKDNVERIRDHNILHQDEEIAAVLGFDDIFVPGAYMIEIATGFVSNILGHGAIVGSILFQEGDRIQFKTPAHPDHQVQFKVTIDRVRSGEREDIAKFTVEFNNLTRDTMLGKASGTAVLLKISDEQKETIRRILAVRSLNNVAQLATSLDTTRNTR